MNERQVSDSETWEKINQIYHKALTLEGEAQDTYVSQACDTDTVLHEEIVSLLTADKSSGDFLQEPIFVQGLRVLIDGRVLADEQDRQTVTTMPPPIAFTNDQLPDILDNRYEIGERIGGGGMGDVYKAYDRRMLNRPVVVKVLKAAVVESAWLVSKFKQEIEAANKIDNPGVVSFFDAGELPDGKPYLVMQYVEGQELRKAIPPDRGMPLDEVAEIIKQIGRTLNIAHEKGIIHRDLKPENIMFRRDENGDVQVKVIDFGIAKIKDSMTAASTVMGQVIGTLIYMSPEQLNPERPHKRTVSATSDVYSLGVIAYEMVTGRRPFNAETAIHLAALQKEGVQVMPCALRPALPEAVQRVILKALAYHPAERYQRVRDFCDELSQALLADNELPPTVVSVLTEPAKPVVLPEPRPPAPKKRWPLVTAAAVLVLASVVAGLWWTYSLPGPERIFSYSLKVQKMRDGRPFEQPFISAGRDVYEKGYKFQVLMTSQAEGYLYLLNEGRDDNGRSVFNMLFPVPTRNGGVARVAADSPIETDWNTFGGQTGTESVWFVWTARPQPDLEEARTQAFSSDRGRVSDESLVRRLRARLDRKSIDQAEATRDTEEQRTVLRGRGDAVRYLLTLEYR